MPNDPAADRIRVQDSSARAADPRVNRLRPAEDPGDRYYVGVVKGLGAGVRVEGPRTVATTPVVGFSGPQYPGGPAVPVLDETREELVDVVAGFMSDGDGLVAFQVDGRWAAQRFGTTSDHPCTDGQNTLCVHAYSWPAYCTWAYANGMAPVPPNPIPAGLPPLPEIGIEGATVVIDKCPGPADGRVVTDWTAVATGETDEHGKYCVDLPVLIATPTDPPTVDPVGGGTSGGGLLPGFYRAVYQLTNPFGATAPSPPSAPFAVGIPNPSAAPALPDPGADPVGGGGPGSGGPLFAGDYFAAYAILDSGGRTTGISDPSAKFTVPAGGPIPRIGLPTDLSLRPGADSFNVYIADGGSGSPDRWALNSTTPVPLTAGQYDVTEPYDPDTQVGQPFNDTARNIPRVTIPGLPAGTLTGDRPELFVGPAGSLSPRFVAAIDRNPYDVRTAPAPGAKFPGATNLTGTGYFRAKITAEDCPPRWLGVMVTASNCQTFLLPSGFCCWKDCFDAVTDAEGGGLSSVAWIPGPSGPPESRDVAPVPDSCFNPPLGGTTAPGCTDVWDTCTDREPATDVPPAPLAGPTPGDGGNWSPGPPKCASLLRPPRPVVHNYRLAKSGYFDRCCGMPSDCDVPAKTNKPAASPTLYKKTNYVPYHCCGGCGSQPKGSIFDPTSPYFDPFAARPCDVRPPYLLRKTMAVTVSGIDDLFGRYNNVATDLTWTGISFDPAADDDDQVYLDCGRQTAGTAGPKCFIVYDSGCLPQSGARGECFKQGDCYEGDCGTDGEFHTRAAYHDRFMPYNSCRLTLVLPLYPASFDPTTIPYTAACAAAYFSFVNYWSSGCPDADPAPVCDPNWFVPPLDPFFRFAQMPLYCQLDCNCPRTNPRDVTWLAQTINTKSWGASTGFGLGGTPGNTAIRGQICAPTNLYMENPIKRTGPCGPYLYAPDPTGSVLIVEKPT